MMFEISGSSGYFGLLWLFWGSVFPDILFGTVTMTNPVLRVIVCAAESRPFVPSPAKFDASNLWNLEILAARPARPHFFHGDGVEFFKRCKV